MKSLLSLSKTSFFSSNWSASNESLWNDNDQSFPFELILHEVWQVQSTTNGYFLPLQSVRQDESFEEMNEKSSKVNIHLHVHSVDDLNGQCRNVETGKISLSLFLSRQVIDTDSSISLISTWLVFLQDKSKDFFYSFISFFNVLDATQSTLSTHWNCQRQIFTDSLVR